MTFLSSSYEYEDFLEEEKFLCVKSDILKEQIEYINKHNITSISINDFNGYLLKNIDFLKKCPKISKIYINIEGINLDGLLYLDNLTYLTMYNTPNQLIDFSKFPELKDMAITWSKKTINISKLKKLRVLRIWKYNSKNNSFDEIGFLPDLQQLKITRSNLENLNGLSYFPKLEKLVLSYFPKLKSIERLKDLESSLKYLEIESCKKVSDFEKIKCLYELEKLILSKTGEIENINFINQMIHLKFFSFVNTTIKDGNLLPLIKLDYAGFLCKKHYSHKEHEIDELIKQRKNN